MSDPRNLVRTFSPAGQSAVRELVHRRLMAATDAGAREIGATGASFVVIGMGIWATELAELDARATADLLRAMAVVFDPKANDRQKARAEQERAAAVRRLFAALDLMMSEAHGHG